MRADRAAGAPLEVGHVATQLLRLRRCPERLQRRLVAEIVNGDARLAWFGRDLVGLAPPDWSAAALASTTFCVVDLETTGGSPGRSKVTEIGAVRVRDLGIEARFSTLVNPGRPIPPVVTELTGIDDGMVADSPDIAVGLEGFVEFAGQDVLVAHNAPFDLRFLNYERRRLAGRYFTQAWLDTLILARRLLDGRVPRHDLGTLAAWADTAVRPSHRALPDAEATAELLVVLIGMLAERGVDTLKGAVAFAGIGGARHAFKLALAEDLPASPGVYVMRDRAGRPLYVGKAGNLRRRVRSYFGPGGRHSRLIGRALEQLEVIDHETCGSEFAALLREDQLIKEMRPPCNRRGTGGAARYLKLTAASPSPGSTSCPAFGPTRQLLRPGPLAAPGPRGRRVPAGSLPDRRSGPGRPRSRGGSAGRDAQWRPRRSRRPRRQDGRGPRRRPGVAGGGRRPGGPQALLGTLAELARARRAAGRFAVLVEPGEEPHIAEAFFVAGGVVRHRALLDADAWAEQCREGLAVLRRHSRASRTLLAPASMDEAAIVGERLRQAGARGRGPRAAARMAHGGGARAHRLRGAAHRRVDGRRPAARDGVLPDG